MPGDGAIILSDLIGKLDVLRVACEKCGRDGSYQLNGLIETRGRCRGNSFALIVYFRRPGLLEMRINLISRQLEWRNMPRKRGASLFIGLNRHRVSATDLKSRLAERDQRKNILAIRRRIGQRWHGGSPQASRRSFKHGGSGLICGDGDLSKK